LCVHQGETQDQNVPATPKRHRNPHGRDQRGVNVSGRLDACVHSRAHPYTCFRSQSDCPLTRQTHGGRGFVFCHKCIMVQEAKRKASSCTSEKHRPTHHSCQPHLILPPHIPALFRGSASRVGSRGRGRRGLLGPPRRGFGHERLGSERQRAVHGRSPLRLAYPFTKVRRFGSV